MAQSPSLTDIRSWSASDVVRTVCIVTMATTGVFAMAAVLGHVTITRADRSRRGGYRSR